MSAPLPPNNTPSLEPFSPKPGGAWARPVPSRQPVVTQEEAALGPQTVKCQLQLPEPGWPDLSVPGPFSQNPAASKLGGRSRDTLLARGEGRGARCL